MSRLYVYKIRYDDGTAPCVEDGLLSLALCKPAIRATAEVGDTLVAFAAKSMCPDQRLVYAAVVSRRLVDGAYYREAAWRRRRDCIYAWSAGAFRRRRNASIHATDTDLVHDLGDAPGYRLANVLLSDNFRYFADLRPADHAAYPAISRMLALLGQGHRVNHGERLRGELDRYLARVWSESSSLRSAVPIAAARHGACAAKRRRATQCR